MSRTTRKIQHWAKKYVGTEDYKPRNPYHNGRDGSACDKYEACKHSPKGFNKWCEVSPLTAWKDKRFTRRIVKLRGKKEITKEVYDLSLPDDEPDHKPLNKKTRRSDLSYSPRSYYERYPTPVPTERLNFIKIFHLHNKIDGLKIKLKQLESLKTRVHKSMINDIDIDIIDVNEKIDKVQLELKKERKGR